jgi:hypothetical protein
MESTYGLEGELEKGLAGSDVGSDGGPARRDPDEFTRVIVKELI